MSERREDGKRRRRDWKAERNLAHHYWLEDEPGNAGSFSTFGMDPQVMASKEMGTGVLQPHRTEFD